MHSDKINLRSYAMQLYFAGDAKRYNPGEKFEFNQKLCTTQKKYRYFRPTYIRTIQTDCRKWI